MIGASSWVSYLFPWAAILLERRFGRLHLLFERERDLTQEIDMIRQELHNCISNWVLKCARVQERFNHVRRPTGLHLLLLFPFLLHRPLLRLRPLLLLLLDLDFDRDFDPLNIGKTKQFTYGTRHQSVSNARRDRSTGTIDRHYRLAL